MAPTECCAKRNVEHTPRVKHQVLSSDQQCKSEDVEYRYLGVCFLLKRNPERIGQSLVLEFGRPWSPNSLDLKF